MTLKGKNANLYSTDPKLSCGLSLVSFFPLQFHNKTTHEARHFRLLCRFNLFKLVCIRSIPNHSRMLLQSKLMSIRFWKRKKELITMRLFLFFCKKNSVSLRKKSPTLESSSEQTCSALSWQPLIVEKRFPT